MTELDPDLVVEADTDLGPLWVERRATILTDSLLELGHWDPALSGLMRKALEPGMTFVDVGANIGYLTILGAQLVGSEGRAFAIEPDPINLSILAANLERHGCSNVTVLPVAAWSERTQLTLTRPPDEGAAAQVGRTEEDGVQVPAAPLDDLIAGPVDYIKIDCEQTDHVVVRGAERLIRENPAMLVTVEFLPEHASHTGESPSEILNHYARMGLSPFWISHPKSGLRPTGYQQIAEAPLPEGEQNLCGPPAGWEGSTRAGRRHAGARARAAPPADSSPGPRGVQAQLIDRRAPGRGQRPHPSSAR